MDLVHSIYEAGKWGVVATRRKMGLGDKLKTRENHLGKEPW